MKIENKLLLRKIKKQFMQLLCAVIIVAVGVGFYVTLKTVHHQYKKVSEEYFFNYSLADYSVYGQDIQQKDMDEISKLMGIKAVEGRTVLDIKYKESTLRMITKDPEINQVNKLYLYEGEEIANDQDCLLLNKYAVANNLNIGDTIEIKIKNKTIPLTIKGLVASPEYVYLAQSENIPMADPKNFGIIYLNEKYIQRELEYTYNQINLLFEQGKDEKVIVNEVKNILGANKIQYDVFQSGQTSYKMYQEDLGQINSFTYIFPTVFFMIGAMIIYVLQKRNITKERKQIGILKAMGLSDSKIMVIYTKYAFIISILGSLIGCLLSVFLGDYILGIFGEMFELPELTFVVYPGLWLIAVLLASIVCILSNFIGIFNVVKINPSEAMHAESPKKGKKILIENIKPLWKCLSFHSRYAIKTTVRNKGRFFAVVFGMSAAVGLILFSLGFHDSFQNIIDYHYDKVIDYDLSVKVPTTPLEEEPAFLASSEIKEFTKAMILPVTIKYGEKQLEYPLLVTPNNFNMLNLKNEKSERINMNGGIALPQYLADQLNLKRGDSVKITSPGHYFEEVEVTVKDLVNQVSGFYIYANYDDMNEKFDMKNFVYNTVFIRTNQEIKNVVSHLNEKENVLTTTSVFEDKNTLLKLLSTINFMITILIGFAFILGITVLFAVNMINLTARRYEFIILKVMGYSTKEIIFASIKENIIQMIISIPTGFIFGNSLLFAIKDEFSNDSFLLMPHIYIQSYLMAALMLIVITILVLLYSIKIINRLNIVEGLKERED